MNETAEDQIPEFSRRIRRFRKDLGLAQHQLAAALGVPESTVYRWEHSTKPGHEYLEKMYQLGQERGVYAQFFDVPSLDSVFFLSDLWKEQTRQGYDRIYLRAVVTEALGVTARVLATLAEHQGNLLRVAGFEQVSEGSDQSILRLLFDLPTDRSLKALKADLQGLDGVISTEVPGGVRPANTD